MSEVIIIAKPPHNRSSIPFPRGENKTIQTLGEMIITKVRIMYLCLALKSIQRNYFLLLKETCPAKYPFLIGKSANIRMVNNYLTILKLQLII